MVRPIRLALKAPNIALLNETNRLLDELEWALAAGPARVCSGSKPAVYGNSASSLLMGLKQP